MKRGAEGREETSPSLLIISVAQSQTPQRATGIHLPKETRNAQLFILSVHISADECCTHTHTHTNRSTQLSDNSLERGQCTMMVSLGAFFWFIGLDGYETI